MNRRNPFDLDEFSDDSVRFSRYGQSLQFFVKDFKGQGNKRKGCALGFFRTNERKVDRPRPLDDVFCARHVIGMIKEDKKRPSAEILIERKQYLLIYENSLQLELSRKSLSKENFM